MSEDAALPYKFLELPNRENAAVIAAEIIAAELDLAAAKYDAASFMVSGGSSPKPIYEALSHADIEWPKIAVGLVDERWVREDEAGSNARFIKDSLMQGQASAASFLPMISDHNSPAEGLSTVHARYSVLRHPFDVALMGMGTDGHTASWFPNSDGLSAALDLKAAGLVSAVDATACPGAGEFPSRITLTRAAIISAQKLILFITGAQKRTMFEKAAASDSAKGLLDYPVRALLDAGERLTVIWAP